MNAGINIIETALLTLWRASWQASVLAGIVLQLQWIFRGQMSARGRYLLWAVVLVRLLIPVLPESRVSIFNWHPLERNRIQTGGVPMTLFSADGTEIRGTMYPAENANLDSSDPPAGLGRMRLSQMVAIAWAAGVLLLAIRIGWTCIQLSRLMRLLSAPQDPNLIEIIDSSAAALGFHWRPSVRCGDAIRRPALVGVWRPTLLLPTRVLEQCDPAEIRLIILHELAHLKRRDVAGNWIITIATLLHWFNPVVWIVAARMRADRELACDEMVLADSAGREARAYGQTLLKLVEILAPAPAAAGQLVGILESSGPMQRRVLMIAKFDPRRSGRWMWALIILLLLCGVALTDAVSQKASAAPPAPPAPATAPAEAMTDAAIQAQLNKVLPEIKFDGNSMGDVVNFLRDVTQSNLLVDWRVLTDFGIDKDTQVSLQLRGVTFGQALDHILRNVGGNAVALGYMVRSGAIVVTTQERIAQEHTPDQRPSRPPPPPQRTVYYEVRDLVGTGDGQSNDALMKELVRVIDETPILTDKGSRADMQFMFSVKGFGTKLIITTTEEGHQHVADLLAHLREKPTTRPR